MFDAINLENELMKIRESESIGELTNVLEGFKDLFRADWEAENRINNTLQNGGNHTPIQVSETLDKERIFELNDIKKLCIKYRLRFLPTRYFNAPFPREAIIKIKKLERDLNTSIPHFMIVAPAKLFKLDDANADPLLFIPLSNNKYYLVHKWGDDLSWHRRLLALPFKSFSTLLATLFVIATLATIAVPTKSISSAEHFFSFGRGFLFLWCLLTLSALTSYLWFALNLKFSKYAWNCKNFN